MGPDDWGVKLTMADDLAALIWSNKGDRSYERLARDCGGSPTAKRLHQMATGPLKNYPDPLTVEGLARGLGVSVTTVVLACSRSLGLEVRGGEASGIDHVVLAGLTPKQAEAVRGVVRAMLDPGRKEAASGRPTKTQAAGEGVIREEHLPGGGLYVYGVLEESEQEGPKNPGRGRSRQRNGSKS